MVVGKRYSPPDCPTYAFFLGKSFEHVSGQGILGMIGNGISVGWYSHNIAEITPCESMRMDRVKQLSKSNPERIIAAPLEKIVDLRLPLVGGRADIYPNWREFVIESIIHPFGTAYMTNIDGAVLKYDYKKQTRGEQTGERRYQFTGGTGEFDPIVRGFATWDSNQDLHHPYGLSNKDNGLYLVILLEPSVLKEILRQFRNKGVEVYGKFLERVAKVDKKIKDFLDYSNERAIKEANRAKITS